VTGDVSEGLGFGWTWGGRVGDLGGGGRSGLGWWEGVPAKRLSGVFIKAITIEFFLLHVEIKFS
jgi:hypothetical protein